MGTDRQLQPQAPFLGSCTALLGAVTGRRGWPKAAFLEEVTLSWCLWGWAGFGEQGRGGRKDTWQEVRPAGP